MRIYHAVLVATFCALSCVPGLTMIIRPEAPHMYGVKVVKYPSFEASFQYLGHFEEFFSANLGFKQRLVELQNALGYRVLHDLQSDTVLVGKKQWLFLKQNFGWQSLRSEEPLTNKEARAWQASFEGARSFLDAHGIPLLLVIVPSKESIYPELLPAGAVRARGPSRLDEMPPILQRARIEYLDLRAPLLEAKRQGQIYDSIDSHWNGLGARVGARLVLERAAQLLHRPESFADLDSHLAPRMSDGDLTLILSLDRYVTQPSVTLVPNEVRARRLLPAASIVDPTREQMNEMVFESPDQALPKALIVRDSFAEAIMPTLAEKFRRSVWAWTFPLDLSLVSRENPDIVIVEMTERFFSGPYTKLLTHPAKRRK